MTLVIAPAMAAGQLESWRGLLAVSARLPTDWCLVGGQLVQLHCWVRGASPNRPTDDGGAVLDVRARPTIVLDFTQALVDEGFEAETSQGGLQHRWVKGEATIDVLIPTRLGPRAQVRTSRGGHPIATPRHPECSQSGRVRRRSPSRWDGRHHPPSNAAGRSHHKGVRVHGATRPCAGPSFDRPYGSVDAGFGGGRHRGRPHPLRTKQDRQRPGQRAAKPPRAAEAVRRLPNPSSASTVQLYAWGSPRERLAIYGRAMSVPVKRTGQPPFFWISLVVGFIALGFGIARIALIGEHGGTTAAGIVIAIVIAVLIIGGFALSIRSRVRDLANAFPSAIDLPITVGAELAAASERIAHALGDGRIRMRPSSYAALAVDAEGVHVASDHSGEFGLIPADRVSLAGYGRSLLGTREMTSLKLSVATDAGDVDFAFVPMRLKGNPVRQLSPEEFADLSAELTKAMSGAAVQAGWPY